jgi:hypothetical protein
MALLVLEQVSLVEHPIALYFIENSGIVDAFANLLRQYRISNEPLDLDPENTEDAKLIYMLEFAIRKVFPLPGSTVEPDKELLRLNMYDRLFGLKIRGKDTFPVSDNRNDQFYPTLREIMIIIFQGIQDQDTDMVKMADPSQLAGLLNDLRNKLIDYNGNGIDRITKESANSFKLLIMLLNDTHLMERLNIRAKEWNERLLRLGRNAKINVPVSAVFESHFQLANDLAGFLIQVVETKEWNAEKAARLYTKQADFFRKINAAWSKIDPETDFAKLAYGTRK